MAGERKLVEIVRHAVVEQGEMRGQGWQFLGHLNGKSDLPQWGIGYGSNRVIGLVVGGETGVRSIYVRTDNIRIDSTGMAHNDAQFVMLLEPRRVAPLSGWRSA